MSNTSCCAHAAEQACLLTKCPPIACLGMSAKEWSNNTACCSAANTTATAMQRVALLAHSQHAVFSQCGAKPDARNADISTISNRTQLAVSEANWHILPILADNPVHP